ncbi:uncharacterized protein LOC101861728 isoform X2 [Aplysia californica]|uniref:Uncharacterized protein LOC101861728 isoform X2 n=1 Tax=Aplysia californica TaxID=6500 RepID=A0ABM1VTN8_APLCA|nr:uncharacterized protein LOC101861728 isoform X2 [Aplysia californica]
MDGQVRSEDVYGEKIDRCLYNGLVKFGKPWPVTLGAGLGLGMGVASCNYEFKYGLPLSRSPELASLKVGEEMTFSSVEEVRDMGEEMSNMGEGRPCAEESEYCDSSARYVQPPCRPSPRRVEYPPYRPAGGCHMQQQCPPCGRDC